MLGRLELGRRGIAHDLHGHEHPHREAEHDSGDSHRADHERTNGGPLGGSDFGDPRYVPVTGSYRDVTRRAVACESGAGTPFV